MSLSSFLLGGTPKPIDNDLDALFRSTAVAKPQVPTAEPTPGPSSEVEKKRKKTDSDHGASKKRLKQDESPKKEKEKKDSAAETATAKAKAKKDKKKAKAEVLESSDDEDNADIEDAYLTKSQTSQPAPAENASDSSDDEGDPSQLVHESVSKSGKAAKVRTKAPKYVPPEETKEQRDARTIFVGNVPIDVAKNKSLLKQFKKHILTHVPHAKIESVRFRSVAFQTPTTKLTGGADEGASRKPAPTPESEGRQHDRERAASWRSSQGGEEKEPVKRQTPQEKKRIAFIKQELHEQVDAVHAYVVFAHPAPRAANLPALDVLAPHAAAALAVEKCDGTVFLGRTLRVDLVARPAADAAAPAGDPKKTLFVGNLDFASKEEDLRVFFETLISAEKGPRGQEEANEREEDEEPDEEDAEGKPKTWVTRVRIIRDRDTQLGKGFAYVQFADRECVDELLALDETKLKFAKRKLRVQRCKTLPGGKLPAAKISGKAAPPTKGVKEKRPQQKRQAVPIVVPKGNPLLGEKLAHLPKEKRKEAKAADADRVARRLAKKKARNALGRAGVKEQPGAGAKKDRERVRKSAGERKGSALKKEQKKSRVRSARNAEKRNAKK
ncbi:hypothetical protein DENSPDRAFT_873549 [Dentipellis sp. KUC8613]|nr:hypothetical protein DENSPDRAFT_873549 [Dentipellis sp. KUC8613]